MDVLPHQRKDKILELLAEDGSANALIQGKQLVIQARLMKMWNSGKQYDV